MKVIQALKSEHRLLMEMIEIARKQLVSAAETGRFDIAIIDSFIDFMSIFSNEYHHGKEERYIFKDIEMRNPTDEHLMMVKELYEDHQHARDIVYGLTKMRDDYYLSETSLVSLMQAIKENTDFHSAHIEKEEIFFEAILNSYYSDSEMESMADKFVAYDAGFTLRRYNGIIKDIQRKSSH